MSRNISIRAITGLIAGAVILCCAAGCGPSHRVESAAAPKVSVKIAIMPRYSPYRQGKRFMPLVKYLRQETGYNISYVSAIGYHNFLSAVESADADFVLGNPVVYLMLNKTRGAYPLAIATEPDFTGGPPRSQYRGVILARADRGITRIADLKGKVIAVGSEMAVAGHLAPQDVCLQYGLDITKDATVVVCPTQEHVIDRLRRGRADAGFVREEIWQEVAADNPGIHPVEYTAMFPGWSVCALGDTDPAVAETLKETLLGLDYRIEEHGKVLIPTGFRSFVEIGDEEYQSVRELMAALGTPY